jgi:hypothetical protein
MFRVVKRKWPIVVAGVILTATIVSLGVVQIQKGYERGTLNDELTQAEQELDELTSRQAMAEQENWQQRLDDARSLSDIARSQLSQSTDSIAANEAFFAIAANAGVTLTEVTVSKESATDYTGLTFSIFPFTVAAQGEPANLLDFVEKVSNGLNNAVVQAVNLNAAHQDVEEPSTISIELVIYTYRGE